MKTVLLDTNLLVLLVIGQCDPAQIGRHSRLRSFDDEAFRILIRLIADFQAHVSLPNVLSEASNLIGVGRREKVAGATQCLAYYISKLQEVYRPSSDLVAARPYMHVGLTDAAIVSVALTEDVGPGGLTVMTDDGPLYGLLSQIGARAINFSHHRTPP